MVGANAAKVAAGLGANVTILDVNLDRLRYLDDVMPPNVTTLYSDRHNIRDSLSRADLLIGAVLIPGAKAPHLVTREDLKRMQPRRGHHRRGHRPGRLRRNVAGRRRTASRPTSSMTWCITASRTCPAPSAAPAPTP